MEGMLHIIFSPLVNSKIPETMPLLKFVDILKKSDKGFKQLDKISNNWLVSKIEIITENNTTKPPIIKTVLIELEMLPLI